MAFRVMFTCVTLIALGYGLARYHEHECSEKGE